MTIAELISLMGIALVAGWTPGPNNTLVANSAARFGFRATFPHVAGIGIGFPIMVFCIALGLGNLFQQSIVLREGLRILGAVVLLWMSWRIATAGQPNAQAKEARPFTLIESASFQWINPKGWVMAIGISSQFADPSRPAITAMIMAACFVFVGFSSASGWAYFGTYMQRWLTTKRRADVFNWTMAALLVLSVLMIAFADLG
ncbi:lysine transporter LysE [Amylibacter marinus]|uniref:Lysine transporter LysE n=1 Tax=Amylibacter marinus TaxID=1475483 RepID=A0ABQ5VWA8_9RHOB|nr:LysE family translocator [Amylibacter marinus]GLQ35383.1 lysine transporter LysE [Amylibacter marinus]